jgi:hypothetical protein
MDALIFNDSGDRFYGGREIIYPLTASGAAVNVVDFRFTMIGENALMMSWPVFEFTSNGDASLVFENIPIQFFGNFNDVMYYSIFIRNGGSICAGNLNIEPADEEMVMRMLYTSVIGADTVLSYGPFRNGLTYLVQSGSILIRRVLE